MASSRGLELMKRYYTMAYATSPEPRAPGSRLQSEQVVKLRLVWKSNNEGFRELELIHRFRSPDPPRESATRPPARRIAFDFTNLVLNRGIPETRFQYESPPTGNTIENFLFDPES
jgi:outer membrane lipoprotein carrier protein